MRILMDEFTLLSNYPVPLDTSLCSAVIAEDDAYVIRTHGAPHFQDVWPGMNVVVMPNVGHVQAYFVGHHLFRKTISTILNRIKDQM
uniref:Secreted protein n=1 Tax=Heterorhabditis bacteriophora TaxID=37862 RepID=A0A1I7WFV5_HETBA